VEWVETTGRTIEEAKDAALDQLGVDEQDAEFEVLEEPRTGLFGRTRGEARVRARIQPAQPRAKVERRDRRRRGKGEGGKGEGDAEARGGTKTASRPPAKSGKSASKSSSSASKGTAARGSGTTRAKSGSEGDDAVVTAADASEAEAPTSKRAPKRRSSTAGGNDDASSNAPTRSKKSGGRPSTAAASANSPGEPTMPMSDDDVSVEGQADLMTTFLSGLLDAFGAEGTISREQVDEDTIELHVAGDDLGLLIGPKGQTLQAVQELARTYVQRKVAGTHHGRVRIDIGGYRQRRREALERFTRQVADQVLEGGVQKALEPMNASDRKVVHDTANGIDGVRTTSEGDEPRRRVVILPD